MRTTITKIALLLVTFWRVRIQGEPVLIWILSFRTYQLELILNSIINILSGFEMCRRISMRGRVRPSVRPSVRMSRVIFEDEKNAYWAHLVPCIRPCLSTAAVEEASVYIWG